MLQICQSVYLVTNQLLLACLSGVAHLLFSPSARSCAVNALLPCGCVATSTCKMVMCVEDFTRSNFHKVLARIISILNVCVPVNFFCGRVMHHFPPSACSHSPI